MTLDLDRLAMAAANPAYPDNSYVKIVVEDIFTAINEAGYMIVPREPTEAMIATGAKAAALHSDDSYDVIASVIFRVMLHSFQEEQEQ